ncbi:hypothetical protein [Timonella senegalensis]|uniref:hypothetical protein n=2 Tax=Timonella senegalensis TaxID=1465825 RepID=UPI002FDDF2E7
MKKTFTRTGLVLALSAAAAFGLTACGSGEAGDKPDSSASQSADNSNVAESEAFINDMKEGVKIIADQIEASGAMTQIMLASDVDQPTQKYGMWVMPYYPSEAVSKFISTVQVDGDKFKVTATSAETSKVWEMDQDGNLTEVAE